MSAARRINAKIDTQKLGSAITAKGYSRQGFAEATGVSGATLYNVLNGKCKPTVTLNKMMCVVLEVPEDTFFIKPEPPKPEPLAEPVQDNHALEEACRTRT